MVICHLLWHLYVGMLQFVCFCLHYCYHMCTYVFVCFGVLNAFHISIFVHQHLYQCWSGVYKFRCVVSVSVLHTNDSMLCIWYNHISINVGMCIYVSFVYLCSTFDTFKISIFVHPHLDLCWSGVYLVFSIHMILGSRFGTS